MLLLTAIAVFACTFGWGIGLLIWGINLHETGGRPGVSHTLVVIGIILILVPVCVLCCFCLEQCDDDDDHGSTSNATAPVAEEITPLKMNRGTDLVSQIVRARVRPVVYKCGRVYV